LQYVSLVTIVSKSLALKGYTFDCYLNIVEIHRMHTKVIDFTNFTCFVMRKMVLKWKVRVGWFDFGVCSD